MKYLIASGNNSLSHLGKALAIRDKLVSRGHEVLIAVSRARSSFLSDREIPYVILPDIQEVDGAGFPGVAWFRSPEHLAANITSERQMIEQIQPDRVLGIFRFTLKAAARLAGIPYDSLCCGCMLPGVVDTLGFAPDEAGCEQQGALMDGFFRYAGRRLSQALKEYKLQPVTDVREMLLGDRTFLWDFPEFQPGAERASVFHVGPIFWNGWHYDHLDWARLNGQDRPLAVLSYGTCCDDDAQGTQRILRVLSELGYHVVSTHGQPADDEAFADRLTWCRFAPLNQLLERSSLFICHGGQLSIFEALSLQVPVAVVPFQPEQAQNGVCLEQLGCGKRLVPGQLFVGRSEVYKDALYQLSDSTLKESLCSLADTPDTRAFASKLLSTYRGNELLFSLLESSA